MKVLRHIKVTFHNLLWNGYIGMISQVTVFGANVWVTYASLVTQRRYPYWVFVYISWIKSYSYWVLHVYTQSYSYLVFYLYIQDGMPLGCLLITTATCWSLSPQGMSKGPSTLATCWRQHVACQHVEDTSNMMPVSGNKLKAFADRNPVLATCWSKLNMFNFWQHVEGPSNKLPLMFPMWTCCCLLQLHVERCMNRHLEFPTSRYIWQYSQYGHWVSASENVGGSR